MRRSIYSVCAATCFIPTALLAQQTVSAPCESSQADKDRDSIQRVLNAENSFYLKHAVAELVAKASRKQLQNYKTHSHNTIALHAAWEEAKRSTTISRAKLLKLKDDEEANPIIRMDRGALRQFISFVEGRLRVTPPKWWRAKVRRAQTYWNYDSALYFPRIDSWFIMGERVIPYSKIKGQVHALTDLDLTHLADGRLKVTSGKLSCTIPARFLKEAKKKFAPTAVDNSWMDLVGLTAWMDAEHCIFGLHDWLSSGFTLHCIDRKTSKPIWSTEVWNYFVGGFSVGATLFHWVEIRRRDDTLFLFGINDLGRVYIEGYSMKDGTNLSHFTTTYHPNPFEEEEE